MSAFRPNALIAAAGLVGVLVPAGFAAVPAEKPGAVPLPAATRGPVRIAFEPGGALVAVTESDTGTLAVLEARSGAFRRRIETGGTRPRGVALAPGGLAVVANSYSGSVAALDTATGTRRALLPLRGEPSEVVLSRDGKYAFVSLAQLNEVAVLELPELRLARRVPVGRRPSAMALTPDGQKLLVANLQGGDVSVVDTESFQETRRISLTGVNLRGISVSPDGAYAFVTGQIPANTRATAEPLDIWTNTVFFLDLRSERSVGAEGWIDFPGAPSPDPDGIVALAPDQVAVSIAGSDEVLRVRTPGPHLRTYDPVIEQRRTVGARPRAVALSPDRRQVWIANELDSTLSVLDASTWKPVRRIQLGTPPEADPTLAGRYLFGNARFTRGGQFTCDSCHPGGNTDGLDWEFVHVPDDLERRNSRNLRGGITKTAPFRWSGHDAKLRDFLREEITGLLRGPEPPEAALASVERLIERLQMPVNPYRGEDGQFTAEALRGKALFEGKAGCANCHSGERAGGAGLSAWIGTTAPNRSLDVPHLYGAYDSAPYLHDARAATLEEIFQRWNPQKRHGNAHLLDAAELAAVLRYVREL